MAATITFNEIAAKTKKMLVHIFYVYITVKTLTKLCNAYADPSLH